MDKYNGLTPLNYFARFKEVISAAESDGYFQKKPTEEIKAKSKPSTKLKEIVEVEDPGRGRVGINLHFPIRFVVAFSQINKP